MKEEQKIILPSHVVPCSLVMDIACRCVDGAMLDNIVQYTGKSVPYVKSAIVAATLLGMVTVENNTYYTNQECIRQLTTTPSEAQKNAVFKIWLQKWKPYITFLKYVSNGDSAKNATRKTSSFFIFDKDIGFVEKLLLNWSKSTGIITSNGLLAEGYQKGKETEFELLQQMSLEDANLRLFVIEALTDEVFAWLTSDEIDEIVGGMTKYRTDPRASIESVGRAFEDMLRRTALDLELDAKKQNGISQVANYLYAHRDSEGNIQSSIHSKQYNISQAIGDIRNMAGHSKEAKTMERWTISSHAALGYSLQVLCTIKSVYLYTKNTCYTY